ncbi:MAG TPA: hypothetical protein VKX49_31910 [Bryobacteraceae bacterium]|nr:hypothetical protein [Bryobacteraceae bacterium]
MPLERPSAPSQAAAAFNKDLPNFLAGPLFPSGGGIVSAVSLSPQPALPTISDLTGAGATLDHDPQEVFVLGMQDIHDGKDLSAATPAGWRFFAGSAPGKVVIGYASQRPPNGDYRLTALTFGAAPFLVLQQSLALDSLSPLQNNNNRYSLRFLRVPGLNVEAFWLFAGANAPDLFVPSPAGADQLQSQLAGQQWYDSSALLSILQTLTADRIKYPAPYGS